MTLLFVDTNVFIYATDRNEPQKMSFALDLLDYLLGSGRGVISTQVVGEFVRTASRGISNLDRRSNVADRGRYILQEWPTTPLTSSVTMNAIAIWEQNQVSYWDAQICAAALHAGCKAIITEDTHDSIEGVRYVNPFAEGFDVATLG